MLVYGSPLSTLKKISLKKPLFKKLRNIYFHVLINEDSPWIFFFIIFFMSIDPLFSLIHFTTSRMSPTSISSSSRVVNPHRNCYAAPRRHTPRCLPDTVPHRDVWHRSASAAEDGRVIAAYTLYTAPGEGALWITSTLPWWPTVGWPPRQEQAEWFPTSI